MPPRKGQIVFSSDDDAFSDSDEDMAPPPEEEAYMPDDAQGPSDEEDVYDRRQTNRKGKGKEQAGKDGAGQLEVSLYSPALLLLRSELMHVQRELREEYSLLIQLMNLDLHLPDIVERLRLGSLVRKIMGRSSGRRRGLSRRSRRGYPR
jgi:hypothetical protein